MLGCHLKPSSEIATDGVVLVFSRIHDSLNQLYANTILTKRPKMKKKEKNINETDLSGEPKLINQKIEIDKLGNLNRRISESKLINHEFRN